MELALKRLALGDGWRALEQRAVHQRFRAVSEEVATNHLAGQRRESRVAACTAVLGSDGDGLCWRLDRLSVADRGRSTR